MTSILIGITVIVTAAWVATGALRRSSAALRHVVRTCAIAATCFSRRYIGTHRNASSIGRCR
jgi:hypothetical protein